MIEKVVFLPRVIAQRLRPGAGAVLISIVDEPVALQSGWKDVLTLRFDDVDTEQEGMQLFDAAIAAQVLAFADRHQDSQDSIELVVHCTAGQSRSAAVALFLAERFGVQCWKEGRRVDWRWPNYNRLVYRVLTGVSQEG